MFISLLYSKKFLALPNFLSLSRKEGDIHKIEFDINCILICVHFTEASFSLST
jgi:hypothetical protein